MAGTTRLELATSAVTGQRSNQLNYVPNRGINNLAQTLANKAFASFAYSARFAWIACGSSSSWKKRPQTAHKNQRAHASFILAQIRARGETGRERRLTGAGVGVRVFRLPCNCPASPRSRQRRHAPCAGAVLAIADCPARRARLCEPSNSAGSGYFCRGGDQYIKSGVL